MLWLTSFVHFKPCLEKIWMSTVLSYIVEITLLSFTLHGRYPQLFSPSQPKPRRRKRKRKKRRRRRWKWWEKIPKHLKPCPPSTLIILFMSFFVFTSYIFKEFWSQVRLFTRPKLKQVIWSLEPCRVSRLPSIQSRYLGGINRGVSGTFYSLTPHTLFFLFVCIDLFDSLAPQQV